MKPSGFAQPLVAYANGIIVRRYGRNVRGRVHPGNYCNLKTAQILGFGEKLAFWSTSYNRPGMNPAAKTKDQIVGHSSPVSNRPLDTPPDWSTLDRELRCPRCDYNLHMLTSPRCPECGLEFEWAALLSTPEYRLDCPIFEYRWRKRPVRSFLFTLWLVLRPWRYWRMIRIEYEPRVSAIAVQIILLFFTHSLAFIAASLLWTYSASLTIPAYPLAQQIQRTLSGFMSWAGLNQLLLTQAAPLPLLLLSLFVYQFTYRRWRIRWKHVVRVGVYAWMTWLMSGLVLQLIFSLYSHLPMHWSIFPQFRPPFGVRSALEALPMAFLVASLVIGFKRYLKLRGAWLAAIASLLLTTTAFATLSIAYVTYGRQRTFGTSLSHLDAWIPGLQWFCLRVLSAK